jgi:hypothetical protein
MNSATPRPIPDVINDLIANNTIPELNETQMSALTQYLFTSAAKPLRIAVAEIAYREHRHPSALGLFLACTLPLAQRTARRKAEKIFIYPSDWQLECTV